ncbi:hypothetical protein H2203_003980 [Taxawa tesnikishii (nom. ined.)]|nr:hypothetical protein H2203_003980 [Dothideales sp. JES 119]
MASFVYVVDSTARRTQIKTTPGTYLRQVLEEACTKLKLNPEQYTLKNSANKQLDLSLTIRLSGLSPEGGGRLQDKFPSTTSLWLVLRKFEDAVAGAPNKKLNLTQRGVPSTQTGAGRLNYEQPCLNVMSRELATFTDLQRSLAQLGYNSGSVLLRLSFKNAGTPMDEAMQQISEYFKGAEPPAPSVSPGAIEGETRPAHGAHANPDMEMTSVPNADADNAAAPGEGEAKQDPSGDTVMTPPPPPASETPFQEPEENIIGSSSEGPINPQDLPTNSSQAGPSSSPQPSSSQPSISVYTPSLTPSNTTFNDSDFEPTADHARSHQATLSRQGQNKRLASDNEIAMAQQSRLESLNSIRSITLRVRLPDNMMPLLASPGPARPARRAVPLRYTGSKGFVTLDAQSETKLIKDLGMSGRVLITMIWGDAASADARRSPVLKAQFRNQAQELKVKEAELEKDEAKKPGVEEKTEKKKEGKNKGDVETRMKRLLGLGKK